MIFRLSTRLALGLVAVLFVACAVPRVPDSVNLRPTPEQRFFDWTRMDFEPEVYAERRANLARRIHDAGGGVFLAPSSDGFSGGETFRQLPDFLVRQRSV